VPILRVPALRERPQDLPLLAARCLIENARQTGQPLRRLSPAALEELHSREWFGNVVELAAVLIRALHRAGARLVIEAEDLPRDTQPSWRPSQYAKDEGQRDCVLRQLRMARNVSAASRLEGCSRANYIRLMRRLGIIRADVLTDPAAEGPEETPGGG
jgi:DNA-binding NtrC family response regulator